MVNGRDCLSSFIACFTQLIRRLLQNFDIHMAFLPVSFVQQLRLLPRIWWKTENMPGYQLSRTGPGLWGCGFRDVFKMLLVEGCPQAN